MAGPTALAETGTGLAIIPIATDRSAEKSALEVGYIAQAGFDRSPSFNIFHLESLLDGQLPPGAIAHQEALIKLREAATAYDALDLTGSLSALTAASIAFEKGTSHWEDSEEIVKTYLLLGAPTHSWVI